MAKISQSLMSAQRGAGEDDDVVSLFFSATGDPFAALALAGVGPEAEGGLTEILAAAEQADQVEAEDEDAERKTLQNSHAGRGDRDVDRGHDAALDRILRSCLKKAPRSSRFAGPISVRTLKFTLEQSQYSVGFLRFSKAWWCLRVNATWGPVAARATKRRRRGPEHVLVVVVAKVVVHGERRLIIVVPEVRVHR